MRSGKKKQKQNRTVVWDEDSTFDSSYVLKKNMKQVLSIYIVRAPGCSPFLFEGWVSCSREQVCDEGKEKKKK